MDRKLAHANDFWKHYSFCGRFSSRSTDRKRKCSRHHRRSVASACKPARGSARTVPHHYLVRGCHPARAAACTPRSWPASISSRSSWSWHWNGGLVDSKVFKTQCLSPAYPRTPPARTSAWEDRVSAIVSSLYMATGVLYCMLTMLLMGSLPLTCSWGCCCCCC